MMKQTTLDKIKKLDRLPQLPQVLLKILDICNRDETDLDELIRVISSDAGLTARLMQILNSAWINLNKEVQSIESAILYLGIASIKNLAISMSVVGVFDSEKSLNLFNMKTFWHHSFKCAMLAQKMARLNNEVNENEAFLAGLMHDIGQLVLMANYPEDYCEILQRAQDDLHLRKLEQNYFDLTHAEVGGLLCKQWHFPAVISDAVLHMNDAVAKVRYSESPLLKTIYAANHLCSIASLADGVDDHIVELTAIDIATLESVMAEVESEALSMAQTLGLKFSDATTTSPGTIRSLTSGAKSESDEVAVELSKEDLNSRVREYALLYGTLETLLHAEDRTSLLHALEMGLKILFKVLRVFYFLCDHENRILTGCCNSKDKRGRVINSIAISLTNKNSLLVKSLMTRELLNSLNGEEESNLATSDCQIIRLLESDVMFSLPMYLPGKPVGVIVIGVDRDQVPHLIQNTGVLAMLAKLASVAIDQHQSRHGHGKMIQRERAGAASDSMRKVIHEINNPLLIITSYLKMLSLKLPENHPAQIELNVIDEEIERIGGLVKELSVASKPLVSPFEWVDVGQLFQNMVEMVRKSILAPNGICADIVVEPGFPSVKTDKNGLKQILINLLKNCSEAMVEGGQIHISLRQVPGSVKIMIDEKRKTDGQIEIVVRDTGPGISDEIMKRLFEPYNSSKQENNSGLGLSIVNTIVRSLNGAIECHTEKGVGTEFKIFLPVSSLPSAVPVKGSIQWPDLLHP